MLPRIWIWICVLALLIALSVATFKMVKIILRRQRFAKKPLENKSQMLSLQRESVPSTQVTDPGLQPGTESNQIRVEQNSVSRIQGDISSKSSSLSSWDTCTSCVSTLDFDENNSGACQDDSLQHLEFGNDMVWKSPSQLKPLDINLPVTPVTENVSLQGLMEDERRKYVHNWVNSPDCKRSEGKTCCASAVSGQPEEERSFEDNFEVDRLLGTIAEVEALQLVKLTIKKNQKRKGPIHIWEAKRKAKIPLKMPPLSEEDRACNDAWDKGLRKRK